MSGVNKETLELLYLKERKSTTDIAKELGVSASTVRKWLIEKGIELRSRTEGINAASHKLGAHARGKSRVFTDKWKENISRARSAWCEKHSKGYSVKSSGYIEITRGEYKGRSVHVQAMEARLGRKLLQDEVVHHIDGNRSNNSIDNLALMTRAGHSRLHRLYEQPRKRNDHGQFC